MRKKRETRDGERALSDVDEMDRSEEQFVREMEVTIQNWEPASQVMTVVMGGGGLEEGRWSQGF